MQVFSVRNEFLNLALGTKQTSSGNFVDVITGPNGSGKTEALDILLRQITSSNSKNKTYNHLGGMAFFSNQGRGKVIVQTFSPFSRFKAPSIAKSSLGDIFYNSKRRDERYISIGLNRSSKSFGFGLSRRVLEDAIFRLSENPERSKLVFSALRGLGFEMDFKLSYKVKRGLEYLLEFSVDFEERIHMLITSESSMLSNQIWFELENSKDELATLKEAVELCLENREIRSDNLFGINIKVDDIRRHFYELQAFSLLKRLNILSLESCILKLHGIKESIDVASISSGQQQMLCAVFGLATSIENDCLVLLDEPELSLHPEWQIKFVEALNHILFSVSDCHVVIATHSPLVVQSAARFGAGIVQLGEQATDSLLSNSRSFEDISVEEALVEVFHTPIAESSHVSNEIFHAISLGEGEGVGNKRRAIERLRDLQKIYKNEKSSVTYNQIAKALRLLES